MANAEPEVVLRAAEPANLGFLLRLRGDPSTAEYLSVRDDIEAELREELEGADPGGRRWLVALLDEQRAGALAWRFVSRRSRLVQLSDVMVDPAFRGRGIGSAAARAACELLVREHDVHKVQLEVYGDNPAAQRVFERAGFRREGVRVRAYWRRDAWQDGVLYGLLAENLGVHDPDRPLS